MALTKAGQQMMDAMKKKHGAEGEAMFFKAMNKKNLAGVLEGPAPAGADKKKAIPKKG